MNRDLAEPWGHLQEEVHRQIHQPVVSIWGVSNEAVSRYIDNAREEFPEPTRRPLRNTLISSQRILARQLGELNAKFEADLLKLRTDALSGLRTAYFGQGMEASYSSANRESGGGSWARKKSIINGTLRNEQLFADLMRKFKNKFEDLGTQLERDAWALVEEHLRGIEGILDMVRSENIALESERDPEFRNRVADEVQDLMQAIDRIRVTVGNA